MVLPILVPQVVNSLTGSTEVIASHAGFSEGIALSPGSAKVGTLYPSSVEDFASPPVSANVDCLLPVSTEDVAPYLGSAEDVAPHPGSAEDIAPPHGSAEDIASHPVSFKVILHCLVLPKSSLCPQALLRMLLHHLAPPRSLVHS